MDSFLRPNLSFICCKSLRALMVFFWFFGLLLGTFIAYFCFGSTVPLIHSAIVGDGLSLTGLLFARLLPFLLTITAFCFSRMALFAPIIFLKAFFFSFTSTSVAFAVASSAWLICFLLLFSEIITLSILWLVWFSVFSENQYFVLRRVTFAVLIVFVFSSIDFMHIAPLLRRLILL